ncbi:hypothetical protein M104_4528 [Bacteroides fragilis str. 1007-1-F |uniref:Uncharacterized protein n=1 Tax=Bacteroides fragilis str. 1007-1-F \|nr:hypothetical protein M104_4528 [Bacteroides fragilis str. 1007-1-F \
MPPKDAEIPTSSNNRYIGQEKAIGFPIAISIKKVLSGGQPGLPFLPSPYKTSHPLRSFDRRG